eukprot:SAG31_NODE_24246_length_486_cov_0.578811_1_plen_45_part_00
MALAEELGQEEEVGVAAAAEEGVVVDPGELVDLVDYLACAEFRT